MSSTPVVAMMTATATGSETGSPSRMKPRMATWTTSVFE
jgi:hypothetical protein